MPKIDKEKCTGCGECESACPVDAIKMKEGKAEIDRQECVDCGCCFSECVNDAISIG